MPDNSFPKSPILQLSVYDESTGFLNTIIETPKGHRNKYKFDETSGIFKLNGVLPEGAVFPFDFGFIPSTLGQDGDPMDVLVLMDEPAFTGCLIACRLIGVIEAEQKEKGKKKERNDRLIAVAGISKVHKDIKKLSQLSKSLVEEIEYFFISYNRLKGKEFRPLGRYDPKRAARLVDKASELFLKNKK